MFPYFLTSHAHFCSLCASSRKDGNPAGRETQGMQTWGGLPWLFPLGFSPTV